MHSKDRLAYALEAASLRDMATRASQGYYHDALSPLATPAMQLAADLAAAGTPGALAVRERCLKGEFDAPASEWEAADHDDEGDD